MNIRLTLHAYTAISLHEYTVVSLHAYPALLFKGHRMLLLCGHFSALHSSTIILEAISSVCARKEKRNKALRLRKKLLFADKYIVYLYSIAPCPCLLSARN